jgi:hypothetical protein
VVPADLHCGLTRHHDFGIGFKVGFRALGLSCGGFLRPFVASVISVVASVPFVASIISVVASVPFVASIISVVASVRGAYLGCRAPEV